MSSAFLPSSGSTTSMESSVGKGLALFSQIKGRKGPMRSAIALFAYRFFGGFVRFGSRTWDCKVIWGSCKRQIHHKPTQNLRARQDPVQVLMERNRQIHLLPGTCDQERDPTGNFVCIGLLQFEVSSPDKSCNCWRSLANLWLLQSLGSSARFMWKCVFKSAGVTKQLHAASAKLRWRPAIQQRNGQRKLRHWRHCTRASDA